MKQLIQILLQFKEVDGGDETLAGLGQAVSGQLSDLMVDEAEDTVGQWENVLWRESLDELGQPLLHLRRGLSNSRSKNKTMESRRKTGTTVIWVLQRLYSCT